MLLNSKGSTTKPRKEAKPKGALGKKPPEVDSVIAVDLVEFAKKSLILERFWSKKFLLKGSEGAKVLGVKRGYSYLLFQGLTPFVSNTRSESIGCGLN